MTLHTPSGAIWGLGDCMADTSIAPSVLFLVSTCALNPVLSVGPLSISAFGFYLCNVLQVYVDAIVMNNI